MQETMQSVKETTELRQWFVMRDLKRGNAKQYGAQNETYIED